MALNQKLKGMNLYRTAIYFPSLIGGSIAVAALWRNMFGLDGYINQVLAWFGIQGMGWITNPDTSLGTLILLNTWQFGSTMVIFLAGLKQIPQELYESAAVDGANKFRRFFSITLPMLSPVMFFNLILGVIGSFQTFTSAFIITKGDRSIPRTCTPCSCTKRRSSITRWGMPRHLPGSCLRSWVC